MLLRRNKSRDWPGPGPPLKGRLGRNSPTKRKQRRNRRQDAVGRQVEESHQFRDSRASIRMPMPLWFHCNICHKRQARSWHVSSCDKVVCQDCLQRIWSSRCWNCRGPCTKTVEINSRAPEDVQRLFRDIIDEIKKKKRLYKMSRQISVEFDLLFMFMLLSSWRPGSDLLQGEMKTRSVSCSHRRPTGGQNSLQDNPRKELGRPSKISSVDDFVTA